MSGRHVGLVLKHSRHIGCERLVLVTIAEALNDKTGTWGLSVPVIVQRAKYGRRHVQRALAALKASGELIVTDRKGPGGINQYRLGLAERPPEPPVAPCSPADDAGVSTQVPPSAPNSDADVTDELTPKSSIPENQNLPPVNHLELDGDAKAKSIAAAILARLHSAGYTQLAACEKLLAIVQAGVGEAALLTAVDEAANSGKKYPYRYALARVYNDIQRGSRPAAGLLPIRWEDAPWSHVQAVGVELGLGKWDPMTEQYPVYKNRVRRAQDAVRPTQVT